MNKNEVREEDYPLEANIKDRAMEHMIAGRNMLYWDEFSRFWQPALVKGRDCWDYVVGDYFSQSEKDDYALKEKIVMNIPGLINKVNALESMQLTGRRNGVILAVGADDAPDKETINYVLGAIQRDNSIPDEKTAAFTDGIVTGYPQFMWFDKDTSWNQARNLVGWHEHWDAVLPDPYFSRQDLSDCRRIIRIRLMSKEEMMVAYPKRRDVIMQEIQEGTNPKDYFAQHTFTSADRNTIFHQINSAQDSFNQTGKMYVIESLFFCYKEMEIWWNTKTGDYEMLPPDWDQASINRWTEMNADFKKIKHHVRILWTTASAQSGLLLENNKHWFQKNEFPCEMYIPKIWNNKPYGIVEFLRGTTKGEAVAKIEHLHSLRQVNDDMAVVQENSIINAQDVNVERARTGGTIVVREGMDVTQAISFPMAGKRENQGWQEFSLDMQRQTDRLSTNPNFEGQTQSSQESAKVVDTRNRATEKKFSPYMNTYHSFDLRVTRKMLMMIPYAITEHQIFRHIDNQNRPVQVEVNKPGERDMMTGDPVRIINNLVGAKYDYVPSVTDDSMSAREFELTQFTEILRDVLPGVPQEYWVDLLMSVGNRYAMDLATKMKETQEALAKQPKEPEPMKKTLSINSEDLLHNPMVQQILREEGILPPLPDPPTPQQAMLPPGQAAVQGQAPGQGQVPVPEEAMQQAVNQQQLPSPEMMAQQPQ